jgi:ADP-heptose:LPS heptosyltransferase
VLVLRPGALGDTLLAVPALRALRRRFAPLTLAAQGSAARLLQDLGEVDAALAFDDPRVGRLLRGENPEEPVVAWLDAARAPDLRALLVAPSRPSAEVHCSRYLLETLSPLGVPQDFDESPLRVQPLRSDQVLIHPGSGSAAKNWPAEHFAALTPRLEPVRLIVGEADEYAAAAVEGYLGQTPQRLESLPLHTLAQRLAGCCAYVGNDSGVSHLAGLCGAPTHVLFGPTSPTMWRPLGPRVNVWDFDVEPHRLRAEIDRASGAAA